MWIMDFWWVVQLKTEEKKNLFPVDLKNDASFFSAKNKPTKPQTPVLFWISRLSYIFMLNMKLIICVIS